MSDAAVTNLSSAYTLLEDSDLDDILSGTWERGAYKRELGNFEKLAVKGIKVNLDSGPFKGKKAVSVTASFNQNIEKLGKKGELSCKNINGTVVLVNHTI